MFLVLSTFGVKFNAATVTKKHGLLNVGDLGLFPHCTQACRWNLLCTGMRISILSVHLLPQKMTMASSKTTTSWPVSEPGLNKQPKRWKTQRKRWMKLNSPLPNGTACPLPLSTLLLLLQFHWFHHEKSPNEHVGTFNSLKHKMSKILIF